MIPANTPYVAVYRHQINADRVNWRRERVVAWDDNGGAMVLLGHPLSGSPRLVPASEVEGLHGIEPAEGVYIGAVPAGGWRVLRKPPGQESYIEPLAAWLVTGLGDLCPATVDAEGVTEVIGGEFDTTPFEILPPEVPA